MLTLPLQNSCPGEGSTWTGPSRPAAGELPRSAEQELPFASVWFHPGTVCPCCVPAVVRGRSASCLRLHLSEREKMLVFSGMLLVQKCSRRQ